ncbi:hypothetical protein [Acidicapsa ligni]|uniref:hypothetical protein n=1 Tax=Acidicapsa ligni TaxID=542300 RepID=UPI0021E0EACF|nr:hypothetical protein [Acidicapsa ligni]
MNWKPALLPIFAALLIALCTPTSFAAEDSIYITTVLKFADFSKNVLPLFEKKKSDDAVKNVTFRLPCIMVYNPAGVLIYYGSDPIANGSFLNHLPESAVGRTLTNGLLQRNEVFAAVPDFAKAKDTIKSDHHYLVFALTQFPSHPMCLPQDSAVRALRQRVGAASVDVLQIALDMKG